MFGTCSYIKYPYESVKLKYKAVFYQSNIYILNSLKQQSARTENIAVTVAPEITGKVKICRLSDLDRALRFVAQDR